MQWSTQFWNHNTVMVGYAVLHWESQHINGEGWVSGRDVVRCPAIAVVCPPSSNGSCWRGASNDRVAVAVRLRKVIATFIHVGLGGVFKSVLYSMHVCYAMLFVIVHVCMCVLCYVFVLYSVIVCAMLCTVCMCVKSPQDTLADPFTSH
jgi:hypothetical protein